jgi:hypothetical protein
VKPKFAILSDVPSTLITTVDPAGAWMVKPVAEATR